MRRGHQHIGLAVDMRYAADSTNCTTLCGGTDRLKPMAQFGHHEMSWPT